jgi:hypothetical protein
VAWYAGIPRYIGIVLASIRAEGRRLEHWPVFDVAAPFASDSLVAFTYYAFWAVPIVALLVCIWHVWRRRSSQDPSNARALALGVALVVMTLVVNQYFLRSNLQARFGDAAVSVVLVGAWVAGMAGVIETRAGRALTRVGLITALTLMAIAFFKINSLAHEFETGGLTVSREQTVRRFEEVVRTLRAQPSTDGQNLDGPLAVSRYLAACTTPDDRVLMGLYADEIPYFARRLVAAGQGYFALGFLRSEADQRLALERLARQSVPIVITALDYDKEIASNYPLVARHISSHYKEAGVIKVRGQPYVRVFVDIMRSPRGTDSVSGFPCFR